MGRKTSVYLSDDDIERIRRLGSPPLGELIRAGLAVLESGWPAQAEDDSHGCDGGPAHTVNDSQPQHGGPAHARYDSQSRYGGPAQARYGGQEGPGGPAHDSDDDQS
jgi:hypothetical protein